MTDMVILASTTSTRQAMLRNAGVNFIPDAPRVDERALADHHPAWTPQDMAIGLAEAKAVEVSLRHVTSIVIGADQVLALGPVTFSKPRSVDDCRRQLTQLRGKNHHLISGVACARGGSVIWRHSESAELTMRAFSDDFLNSYLGTVGHDCTSSVGGYKIEGRGLQLFSSIRGDHFTILGLPLLPLLSFLRDIGEIAT